MVNIRQNICPSDKWHIKAPYSMVPEFIVTHNTANDASANNEILYMNRNNDYVSYHYAVDDVEIVQGLPLDRNGWHAGDGANGAGNRKGIGIEICYSKSGGARFDQAERNAAWLTAKLLKERGWGIDRVKKHQDFMNKYCPHRTLDYGWQRYLSMVQAELDKLNQPTTPPAPSFTWIELDEPKTLRAPKDLSIYELPSLKILGYIKAGADTPFVQKAELHGKAFLRSQWSKEHDKNNGVMLTDLAEIPAPEPPKPEPAPEPNPQPEPSPSEPFDNHNTPLDSPDDNTNTEETPKSSDEGATDSDTKEKIKLPTETIEDLIKKGTETMENYKDIAEEAASGFDFSDKTKKIVYLIGDAIILGGVITPMLIATITAPDTTAFATALSQLLVTVGTGLLFTFKLLKKKN